MIRVTLDTNTLASGALERPGTIAQILQYWRRGMLELVISDHILEELERTLRKPYFASRIADRDRRLFLSLLREFATVVEISGSEPTIVSQRGDNLVLATALRGGVQYIVSGDRELQDLTQFGQIRIVSPRDFVTLLATEEAERFDGTR